MAYGSGLIWNEKLNLYETEYTGKEIIITPEKNKNMSWINKIFRKKEGGSFFGNLFRSIANSSADPANRTIGDYLPEVRTNVNPSTGTFVLVGVVLAGLYLIFKK